MLLGGWPKIPLRLRDWVRQMPDSPFPHRPGLTLHCPWRARKASPERTCPEDKFPSRHRAATTLPCTTALRPSLFSISAKFWRQTRLSTSAGFRLLLKVISTHIKRLRGLRLRTPRLVTRTCAHRLPEWRCFDTGPKLFLLILPSRADHTLFYTTYVAFASRSFMTPCRLFWLAPHNFNGGDPPQQRCRAFRMHRLKIGRAPDDLPGFPARRLPEHL